MRPGVMARGTLAACLLLLETTIAASGTASARKSEAPSRSCQTYFGASLAGSHIRSPAIAAPPVPLESALTLPALYLASSFAGEALVVGKTRVSHGFRDFTVITARDSSGHTLGIIERNDLGSFGSLARLEIGDRPILFLHPYTSATPPISKPLELTSPTSAIWSVNNGRIVSLFASASSAARTYNNVKVSQLCAAQDAALTPASFLASQLWKFNIRSKAQKALYTRLLMEKPSELKFWLTLRGRGDVHDFPVRPCPGKPPCFDGILYFRKLGGQPID